MFHSLSFTFNTIVNFLPLRKLLSFLLDAIGWKSSAIRSVREKCHSWKIPDSNKKSHSFIYFYSPFFKQPHSYLFPSNIFSSFVDSLAIVVFVSDALWSKQKFVNKLLTRKLIKQQFHQHVCTCVCLSEGKRNRKNNFLYMLQRSFMWVSSSCECCW
jgi:hypothetical protein